MWKKKLYIKNNLEPYPINRTKIELFNNCRKCFYNDITYGVRRPHGPPLVLNNTLHQIMTKEFDDYRKKKIVHPIMLNKKYDMLPSSHSNLIIWRNPFSGIRYHHKKTNFQLIGAVDDLWFDNKSKKYFVVAYKSTSKKKSLELTDINETHWKQLSFYNYLLKKNNLNISEIGFIIYLNAEKNPLTFNKKLNFDMNLFSKQLDISWIDDVLENAFKILQSHNHPPPSYNCKYCQYVNLVNVLK